MTHAGLSGPVRARSDGFVGGGQVGFNWQTGAMVLGLETDFQGSAARGNLSGSAGARSVTGRVENPWGGTIRARVGLAADQWLFYVTGGAAYAHTKVRGTVTTAGVSSAYSSSATAWTLTVGAGVETALWDCWTVKGEYLYGGKPKRTPSIPGIRRTTGDFYSHVTRVGVNYRF